ncbi:AraC family transcriptional regulator [Vibrio sp. TH_r3]|uniref:AraC family transcriptional regulator n=1 Tax=Vibrio sp. TH_r3 TaxID=3082084 RepID=UPI002955148F|nr:AraC family transcriptional regulator [Vibrio sp. TH_r3]MDV7103474.1 AraC family transcriptional regulator [Vibrio sp. TH_r3]
MSNDCTKKLTSNQGTFTRRIQNADKQVIVVEKKQHRLNLVEGRFVSYRVNNGLVLHGGTLNELEDYEIISMAESSIIITVLLEGKLAFGYDHLSFDLNSDNHGMKAVVVNLNQPSNFRRVMHHKNKVAKLNIMLPAQWVKERLEPTSNIHQFISQHLAYLPLHVSDAMMTLTSQILKHPEPEKITDKLRMETLAQLIIVEAFEQVSQNYHSNIVKAQPDRSSDALDALLIYIEENLQQALTSEQLANTVSMSVSSLQRKFKQRFGVSMQVYVRRRRLNIAKQKLEAGLIGITEAAYASGYKHPSNFTCAFKKAFGYPPALTTDRH